MTFTSVNPATGAVIAEYPPHTRGEVTAAIDRCRAAQEAWSRLPIAARAVPMRRIAELLRERKKAFAELMMAEMGKLPAGGVAEIEKCAGGCEYYAERADAFLRDEAIPTDFAASYVSCRPLGIVLAIMPWNFPFWQLFRFAAPALMAGNGALLKHAPNVLGCAAAIETLFLEAGFPAGLLPSLRMANDVTAEVIADRRVAAVTLTGSTRAGREVAAAAGAALKKTVLELGGSDPYLILADADLALAAENCVASRLMNGGQSCIAAKRLIVDRSVAADFTAKLVARMAAIKMGDPALADTELGPLARLDLRDALHRQVRDSVAAGAELLLGGTVPDGDLAVGAYYPPTVLSGVRPGMPAYEEELFGPVASILVADDEEDAIRLANDTAYGLGGGVFTRDIARGRAIAADRINAGACWVNGFLRSDPRLPFGGIGESGYGRELGPHGIREFVNIKTVCVA